MGFAFWHFATFFRGFNRPKHCDFELACNQTIGGKIDKNHWFTLEGKNRVPGLPWRPLFGIVENTVANSYPMIERMIVLAE